MDYDTHAGIGGLSLVVEGVVVATTDTSGIATIPSAVETLRFDSATHGRGHLHIVADDGSHQTTFRIRRSVVMDFVLSDSPADMPNPIGVRLDRQCLHMPGRDAPGVVQPMTELFSLSPGAVRPVRLVIGHWTLSTAMSFQLMPYRVDVRSSGTVFVRAAIAGPSSVSGVVVDALGNPCRGVSVVVRNPNARSGITDDRGRFVVDPNRRAISSPVYLDIGTKSDVWRPQERVGPFASGQNDIRITLHKQFPMLLRVDLDDQSVEAYSVRVFRSPGQGAIPMPESEIIHPLNGHARIGDPITGLDYLEIELASPRVTVSADELDLKQVSEDAADERVVVLSLARSVVSISIAERHSGSPIENAVVEVVDSPGGWHSLSMQHSGIRGVIAPTTQSRHMSSAHGRADILLLNNPHAWLRIVADGYQKSLLHTRDLPSDHRILLSATSRLAGRVVVQVDPEWTVIIEFTPDRSHTFWDVRSVPVVEGKYEVGDLLLGSLRCRLTISQPSGHILWDLGTILFDGQEHHDFDASELTWTLVTLRPVGVRREHDTYACSEVSGDTWIPTRQSGGLPDSIWLPQGEYIASWVSSSDLTGDLCVAQKRFAVAPGEKQIVVPLQHSTTDTMVACLAKGKALPNAWFVLRHYGFRRTDADGVLHLEGSLVQGATVHRATFDEQTRSLIISDDAARLVEVQSLGMSHLQAHFR